MTDLEFQVLASVDRGEIYRTASDDAFHRKTGPTQYVEITHAETRAALNSLDGQGMLAFTAVGLNPDCQQVSPSDTGAVVLLANGGLLVNGDDQETS